MRRRVRGHETPTIRCNLGDDMVSQGETTICVGLGPVQVEVRARGSGGRWRWRRLALQCEEVGQAEEMAAAAAAAKATATARRTASPEEHIEAEAEQPARTAEEQRVYDRLMKQFARRIPVGTACGAAAETAGIGA